MNSHILSDLQLMVLCPPAKGLGKWLGSVSKPSRFLQPDVTFHKRVGKSKAKSSYATTATESMYVWNMNNNFAQVSATSK